MWSGVKTQRFAGFFQHPVKAHVLIVMNRLVTDRRDHETRHLRMIGILLNDPFAGFRFRKRQVKHRMNTVLGGQHIVGQPFVVTFGQANLDLDFRVHAERQHRRRKRDLIIQSHAFHGAADQNDIPVRAVFGFGDFLKALIVADAPTNPLVRRKAG